MRQYKVRIAFLFLVASLVTCGAFATHFSDHDTPVLRFQAMIHSERSCIGMFPCSQARPSTAPQGRTLSASEHAQVKYHLAMEWIYKLAADYKGEPIIDFEWVRRATLRREELCRDALRVDTAIRFQSR